MQRSIFLVLWALPVLVSACAAPGAATWHEEENLLKVCNKFLDEFSAGRYNQVEALFAPDAVVAIDAVDSGHQRILTAAAFLELHRSKSKDGTHFREFIDGRPTIRMDHNIACVWSPYRIESSEGRASGIDVFQLIRLDGEWRVVSLTYTNRKEKP
jgi:hypothetical protein